MHMVSDSHKRGWTGSSITPDEAGTAPDRINPNFIDSSRNFVVMRLRRLGPIHEREAPRASGSESANKASRKTVHVNVFSSAMAGPPDGTRYRAFMSEGNRRGAYPKGIAKKRAIIEAATRLFAERGYSAGSTRELAARVGMTQSGMLHHFSSKEELLTEVLRLRDQGLIEALDDAEATQLHDVMSVTMRVDGAEPGLTRLFTVLSAEATNAEHPAHSYFTERYATVQRMLTDWYSEARERGDVVADLDPDLIARLIIAVMDGALLQPAYLDGAAPADLTDTLWALLRGYRPPKSEPNDH